MEQVSKFLLNKFEKLLVGTSNISSRITYLASITRLQWELIRIELIRIQNFLQRSFPLTEEEYLLRLDDVANTLKCWGAVSHIRNSLATVKERPRIGKVL